MHETGSRLELILKTACYVFEQCSKINYAHKFNILLSGNVKFNKFKLYEGRILFFTHIITYNYILCILFS